MKERRFRERWLRKNMNIGRKKDLFFILHSSKSFIRIKDFEECSIKNKRKSENDVNKENHVRERE